MKKKFSVLFSFVFAASALSAQNIVSSKSDFCEKVKVVVRDTETPSSTDNDPLAEYLGKEKIPESKKGKWAFIHIKMPFLSNVPKYNKDTGKIEKNIDGTPKTVPTWLDNVKIKLESAILPPPPKDGKNSKVKSFVLHGEQLLNPLHSGDKTHHIRFFIQPQIVKRFIIGAANAVQKEKSEKGKGKEMNEKKALEGLNFLLTVYHEDKLAGEFFICGDTVLPIVDGKVKPGSSEKDNKVAKIAVRHIPELKKLRDSKSTYFENSILPAEYTPWANRSNALFESMQIEKKGNN